MREKGYFEFVNVFKCNNLPTGSACGIASYYMRASVFPRVWDYRINLVVRAISLILMPLEFLRCDVPVSSKLAWWQQLVTHVSESLKTVSLIQATTSLPILWSIECTLTITSFFHFSIIKLEVDEHAEDLFQRLMSFTEDNLLVANGPVTHHGAHVTSDEELTPTLENMVVLT